MAEIKLVTQNDEPALALGEYLLSEDGETLYVGSAGVGSGDSEVIYQGISPAKIKYGVFSRLPVIDSSILVNISNMSKLNGVLTRANNNIISTVVAKSHYAKDVYITWEV